LDEPLRAIETSSKSLVFGRDPPVVRIHYESMRKLSERKSQDPGAATQLEQTNYRVHRKLLLHYWQKSVYNARYCFVTQLRRFLG
jgi:hypothetical protein